MSNDSLGSNPQAGGFTLSPIAVAVAKVNGEAPETGWQLPVGNYEVSTTTAELIHPRPDSETPVWAKHRRHYPGIPYAIPIGVSFGSWPFFFEIVTLPSGATIGQQLIVAGDKLVAGDDYGVVEWDNPTIGIHPIHIRVHNQDGSAPVDVQWTLEVTTSGTVFVDATATDDSGTGAIGDPFKTLDGWFKADFEDRTFTGYQVCYKAGTYDVTTSDPATSGTLRMNWFNKPLVHYSTEGAIWDHLQTITIAQVPQPQPAGEEHFSDWFMGGITGIGGKQTDNARRWNVNAAASGSFPYNGTGGGMRNTWFRSPQKDWNFTGASNNNGGICFSANTGDVSKTRSHWLISQSAVTNITSFDGGVNFNGWFTGNMTTFLVENLTVSSTNFGRGVVSGKSSEYKTCYRNIDLSDAPDQIFNYDNAGSYAPLIGGGSEISYCKVNYTKSAAVATAMVSGHHVDEYNGSNTYHLPNTHFRNNMSKAPSTAGRVFRAFADWPTSLKRDIWCSDGDGIYLAGPINTQQDGEWELYNITNNPFDVGMNLIGVARVNYLGTKGAEVAS